MVPDDTELLACIRQRDADAFETLAARYREPLRRHLLGIARDPAAAEDLLQEVLLRVWMRAEQWDGRGEARAWLFRIATNLALNHLRTLRRRRERPLEHTAGTFADEEEPPAPAWMVDTAALPPDRQVEQAEAQAQIWRLVNALPEEKRAVFRLAVEEDFDLREVAARLDIPEGTVRSRLFHARKRLTHQWKALEREGDDLP